jgi:hypothetical protein
MGRFKLSKTQQLGVEAALRNRLAAWALIEEAGRVHVDPLRGAHEFATAKLVELVSACSEEAGKEIPEGAVFDVQRDESGRPTGFVTWETPESTEKKPEEGPKAEEQQDKPKPVAAPANGALKLEPVGG